ncbi:MAG: lipid A biosynthesis lauroyl acyltransferase [Rhodobiaceae bacterium]|nr:lipid A biosynthesis lauroyl acyltransferase [Rhodobiaceae bacterium]MCC0015496.1 lipid A biosynthesis lauroyl acyltransferase [Rhodobiaceae bacterium]MCC0040938.1 lipid A biosynthesis lauroyl acyltransferase [Rhodobiaceae bacterium]MCC0053265.1 lipid A biosynthesis lauroyl acyltransferase [Rhodobiaceae bacterium]
MKPDRKRHSGRSLGKQLGDWLVYCVVSALLRVVEWLGPDRASNLGGAVARSIGPHLGVSNIARANLRLVFPRKSDAEREAILRGVWDNLGRTACEYPHLDRLYDFEIEWYDPRRVEVSGIRNFQEMLWDGKPAIIFNAHLGNWELPAVSAARHGLDTTILFRPPSNAFVAQYVMDVRAGTMGRLLSRSRGAIMHIAASIERGDHLGLLVDQRYSTGLSVPFFGVPTPTNTTVARVARQYDCPVYGSRCIRLPDNRFRLEVVGPIDLPRDDDGRVDIAAATLAINKVIEGWIREHPEQWLWLHNRWAFDKRKLQKGKAA